MTPKRPRDPNQLAKSRPLGTLNSYRMVTAIPAPEFGLDKFAMIAELDKRNMHGRRVAPARKMPGSENYQTSARRSAATR
jgi:hypothetical protein